MLYYRDKTRVQMFYFLNIFSSPISITLTYILSSCIVLVILELRLDIIKNQLVARH